MTLVKFCGITRPEDAATAVRLGADAVGINFHPASVRFVSDEARARDIAAASGDKRIVRVGVFVNRTAEEILHLGEAAGLDQYQLHGDEGPDQVRALAPKAYKAFRVQDESILTRIRFYPHSLFLLDAYSKDAYGGTGETFAWDIARKAKALGRVILAGGLTPENVGEAIRAAQPAMVDVAGGIESEPGVKDTGKMEAFIAAVREADAALAGEKRR